MKLQFPEFASRVQAITNGIHVHTWTSDSFKKLFDTYHETLGDWRMNPENLSRILELKNNNDFRRYMIKAHESNKDNLTQILKPWHLQNDVLTIGWARRIAGYKSLGARGHETVPSFLAVSECVGPRMRRSQGRGREPGRPGG